MSGKAKLLIITLIIVVLSVLALTVSLLADRIPENPTGTVGNTAGNMLNGGYFCEMDGNVYFANASDSMTLYSMKPDETSAKRLGSMGTGYIAGAGKFLYFFMDSSKYTSGKGLGYVGHTYGIYRFRISNKKITSLDRANPAMLQLCGNYIYFSGTAEDGLGLYKISIDGKERKKLSDSLINPAGCDGRMIYFAGIDDPSLYYINTWSGDMINKAMSGNISSPVPYGDFIFYIDNAQDYHICRMNPNTGENTVICDERVDFFNTDGRYIWYAVSVGDRPGLRRMNINGGEVITIADGVYNSINLTSRFVYFAPFTKDGNITTMYHVPIDSIGPVSVFNPEVK